MPSLSPSSVDPTSATSYTLCVYGGTASIHTVAIPANSARLDGEGKRRLQLHRLHTVSRRCRQRVAQERHGRKGQAVGAAQRTPLPRDTPTSTASNAWSIAW